MAVEDFPTLYKNVGLDSMDDPLLSGSTLGNIFQTATGNFNTGDNSWYADPSWANTSAPTGNTGPMGGTMFGPSGIGGAGDWDPNAWNPDMGSSVGQTGYTPGGLQVGGQGITTLPAQTTSANRINVPSIIGSTLIGGPIAGVGNLVGQGAKLGWNYLTGGSTGTATGTATVMEPYKVTEKRYDEYGNEIFPFDVPNPLVSGANQYGPQVSGPTVVMPPYTVTATTTSTTAPSVSQPYLGQPVPSNWYDIARQAATVMPPMVVSGGTPTNTGTSIGGGSLTVPGQTPPTSIFGPAYVAPGGGGSSGSTGSTGGGTIGTGSAGAGTGTGTGTGTGYTAPTVGSPTGRNYFEEGRQSLGALQNLMPGITALYGSTAQGASAADLARLQGMVGGIGGINQDLTSMAAQQTAAANSALRAGNIADAQKYAQAALDLRKQANPELYAGMNQYQQAAQGQVSNDLARLQQAQAKQLSPEDLRNAQQAAREAYAARGLVMGKGAIGAEILNRDALARQREQEARTNLGTSLGQLYQGIGARTANVFDPMAAVLGQQYGMQTSNVGLNQNLFNQAAGLSSGAYGNQYAQQMSNPYNQYSQDVYNTNFNAAAAKDIAAMNNAAAIEAARLSGNATTGAANTALWANLIGSGVKGIGQGIFGGG